MNLPTLSDKDHKYDIGLMILGGIISYASTYYGGVGMAILLVLGTVITLAIGAMSESLIKAILLGAFFGLIIVTSSSQLVRGHNTDWNDNVLTSVFVPYFKTALTASIVTGAVAAFGHSLQLRKR